MVEVLEGKIANLQADMLDEANFDSPNWDKIQLDRLAQIKTYKTLISYLS